MIGMRCHQELVLPTHMKDGTAGHQELQLWASPKQVRKSRSGFDHVLKVIEHEQKVLLA